LKIIICTQIKLNTLIYFLPVYIRTFFYLIYTIRQNFIQIVFFSILVYSTLFHTMVYLTICACAQKMIVHVVLHTTYCGDFYAIRILFSFFSGIFYFLPLNFMWNFLNFRIVTIQNMRHCFLPIANFPVCAEKVRIEQSKGWLWTRHNDIRYE